MGSRYVVGSLLPGIFGFLRSGEFTAPEDGELHLSFSDIAVDSLLDPKVLSIQSKPDPFRLGVTIFVGKTNSPLCPVSAVLAYMAWREGPLLRFQSGLPLSRSRLVAALCDVLGEAGYNPEEYTRDLVLGLALPPRQQHVAFQ